MDIKLFVCCHKPTQVPPHPLLVPIQTGAVLADTHLPGFLYDDTGDNISEKNRSYCELTAHYWAWKNIDADYYGFFHYRRYLYPDVNARWPYRIEREPSLPLLEKLGYSEFADLIKQYDLILPKGENMYLPVQEHYANAPFHHRRDLELMRKIVCQHYPNMVPALEQYFSNTICYFGNIFIMKRRIFCDYCAWLFSLLEEFDKQADWSNRSSQELRVDGYLAERLLGVYAVYLSEKLRVSQIPRVHFNNKINYISQQISTLILPPGTKRRYQVKRIWVGKKDGK